MLTLLAAPAGADTTAFRLPASCSAPAPWTNPARAQSDIDGGLSADTSLLPEGVISTYLKCTGFGFAVPTGSTINGITLQVRRSRGTGAQAVADGHVHPVRSDDAPIGSPGAGNDMKSVVCPSGDWGTTATTSTYGGPANTWGIGWGACDPGMQACPGGSFNVNHPNFGVALAAEICTDAVAPANERGLVDWMKVQITYTPPPCAEPFPATTVINPNKIFIPADARINVTTNYAFQFPGPSNPSCALTPSSLVTVKFPPSGTGPDASNVLEGSMNGTPFNTVSHSADTVTFNPPATLTGGATVTLTGVKNPAQPGTYHLEISATPTQSGMASVTSSNMFEIIDPCIAGEPASAWGPVTVTLSDDKQSVAGCPRFTRYTITSTSPAAAGCTLASGTSNITLTLPTQAGVSLDHVTAVALEVDGAPIASTFTTAGNVITITPGAAVPSGKSVEITVDVVRNPDAMTSTAVVKLKGQVAPGTPTGETTSPAFVIAAATVADCAPRLDFYVRDWTDTLSAFDTGSEPSTSSNFVWKSDVWNQSYDSTPVVNASGWITGDEPWMTMNNYAFARISLVPTTAIAYDRDVTARFYAALLGSGSNFVPIATVHSRTLQLGSDAPPNTYVDLVWQPGTFFDSSATSTPDHLCLAVELDSPSDPLVGSIASFPVGSGADSLVVAHNNRAQRNLHLVATPNPIPPPPAPPPGGGMGGGMSHFAIIHNEATRTRDITMRFDAPAEVVRQLVEPRVEVIGAESVPYQPGKQLTFAAMRPGESRWIALSYGLKARGEGEMLPVGFSQVDGDRVVNGFAFGIRPSPLPAVVAQNLRVHVQTLGRLGAIAGHGEAKRESAAAAALLEKGEPTAEAYVRFMRDHQKAIAAITARLVEGKGATDPVGLAIVARELGEAVSGGDAAAIAANHLALLERISTLQTMRLLAEGNPFDIVQMVLWQHDLYETRPSLSALPVAAGVVKTSRAFLDVPLSGKGDGARYGRVVADSMKAFRATADALGGEGNHVRPALEALGRQLGKKNTAALENAHREFLLALDDATSGSAQARK